MNDKKLSLVPNNASQEKNVLMVAYLFPPLGGSGALRPLKLAKYLPEFGWRPLILTVDNPDWYYARDSELLDELSPETRIFRSSMVKAAWIYRMFNPFRIRRIDRWIRKYLLHPDEQIGWLPFACRKAIDVVRQHRVKAVYSTSGPLTDHLVAYFVKKNSASPGLPNSGMSGLRHPICCCPPSGTKISTSGWKEKWF